MLHALHTIVLSKRGVTISVCYCLFLQIFLVHCSTPSLSYSDELECSHEEAICAAGASLRMRDFEDALSILQAAHSDAIGAPKVCTEAKI